MRGGEGEGGASQRIDGRIAKAKRREPVHDTRRHSTIHHVRGVMGLLRFVVVVIL